MYAYSLREKTHAAHTMQDDVPEETKQRRLREIIETFRRTVQNRNERLELGAERLVLVEGPGTKSTAEKPSLTGRTDGNKRCVFDAVPLFRNETQMLSLPKDGDYVVVRIKEVRTTTLLSDLVRFSTLQDFYSNVETKSTAFLSGEESISA